LSFIYQISLYLLFFFRSSHFLAVTIRHTSANVHISYYIINDHIYRIFCFKKKLRIERRNELDDVLDSDFVNEIRTVKSIN